MNNNKPAKKKSRIGSKSFMAAGPTLHYSHKNVQRYWLLAVVIFTAGAAFWSKIQTGSLFSFNYSAMNSLQFWDLGHYVTDGVGIFEYPWQIAVLGLIMGTLAVVPVLVSQLMSFKYSIPFILALVFPAGLGGFALCTTISCVAAASRPLRFRSRFIAIVLCTTPQILYWAIFGSIKAVEPVRWSFSYTPWICAWLAGLIIAALVLGIGHFSRYKPGLVWLFSLIFIVAAIGIFETKIGFGELDYQLYVAKNNPEKIDAFRDHGITGALDETLRNPAVRKYLKDFFYPAEPIALRRQLKKEIQFQLSQEHWPSWFSVPPELKYRQARQRLFNNYDLFINRRPDSRKMPIALYYKAMLSEYTPDINLLGEKEILHFYSDYPNERSREIWYRLYREFPDSPESLEARWRVSKHWVGQGRFEQADNLLAEAQTVLAKYLRKPAKQAPNRDSLFGPFCRPADSVMTVFKLKQLKTKLDRLEKLISRTNITNRPESAERLAKFVMLNPHSRSYDIQLEKLLQQMTEKDPLRDNVLLAKINLIADEQLRSKKLTGLHKQFGDTDGGRQALYELAVLKKSLWQKENKAHLELKKKYLSEARTLLKHFIELYPDSIYIEQARENLENLPAVEP